MSITGTVDARGGGGGGGGMIWVHGDTVSVTGSLLAAGGAGHPVVTSVSLNQNGGNGANGRIRVSGPSVTVTGTVSPARYEDAAAPDCDRW